MKEMQSTCSSSPVEKALRLGDTLDVDQGPSTTIPSRITNLIIKAMGLSGSRFAGSTVLDFGCGGGHLSLAALELGAKKIIGVDCDENCANTFRHNLAKSRFEDKQIEFILADGLHDLPARLRVNVDIIVSNPAQLVLPHELSLPKYGYDGPEGRNMLDNFLDWFDSLLSDNGIAFISNSCFSNPAKTIARVASLGFKTTIANEGMIDLYEQMYAHELLENLKSLPYLGDNDFLEESSCHYKFRAFCFKVEQ